MRRISTSAALQHGDAPGKTCVSWEYETLYMFCGHRKCINLLMDGLIFPPRQRPNTRDTVRLGNCFKTGKLYTKFQRIKISKPQICFSFRSWTCQNIFSIATKTLSLLASRCRWRMALYIFSFPYYNLGVRGGAVVWGTALLAGRSRVRFPMVSKEFFIDVILPAALWLWSRLSL